MDCLFTWLMPPPSKYLFKWGTSKLYYKQPSYQSFIVRHERRVAWIRCGQFSKLPLLVTFVNNFKSRHCRVRAQRVVENNHIKYRGIENSPSLFNLFMDYWVWRDYMLNTLMIKYYWPRQRLSCRTMHYHIIILYDINILLSYDTTIVWRALIVHTLHLL